MKHSARRILWGLILAVGFYMLLIDTVDLPELYAMVVVVALASLAYLVARQEEHGEASFDPRWLLRAGRPIAGIPRQIGLVSVEALRQLRAPSARRGRFVAVPFAVGEAPTTLGRIALAEGFGSLAPNTIVIGVDEERGLLLVHVLSERGGPETLDVMRLG